MTTQECSPEASDASRASGLFALCDAHAAVVAAKEGLARELSVRLGRGFALPPEWVLALARLHALGPVAALSRRALNASCLPGTNCHYAVERLVSLGYLAESAHGNDRRVRLVTLTDQGRELVEVAASVLRG